MRTVYLDNVAASAVPAEVLSGMLPYFTEYFGNPQSRHKAGKEPRQALEDARAKVAALINAEPQEIYFTSCGTEANNTALNGVIGYAKGKHIIASGIEHHSVIHFCKKLEKAGYEITYLNTDKNGLVEPDELRKSIRPDTVLVSVMHGNNEIGVIEPVSELVKIAHEKNILFHTDAVATAGIIPVDVKELGVDLLSISSQQFGGPKGAGALFVRKGVRIQPYLYGGIQESGRRAGTENIPAIVGMGIAAGIAKQNLKENLERMTILRNKLIDGIIKIPFTWVTGDIKNRLPNIASFCFQYIEGESITLLLQSKGIMASSGSTCSSHALKASHVLLSIGVPADIAQGSIVFSLGRDTSSEDVEYVIESLAPIVERLRSMSPLYEDMLKQQNSGG